MKLKSIKKMLTGILASSVVLSSVSAIGAMATSPHIYVDISYESNGIYRADIMFNNVPDVKVLGFHLDIGTGWTVITDDVPSTDGIELDLTRQGTTSEEGCLECRADYSNYVNGAFVTLINDTNFNYNGKFLSLYFRKSSSYSSSNSYANVEFISGDLLSQYDSRGNETSFVSTVDDTQMLRAEQYVTGDSTGNGYVDARDASKILNVVNTSSISVLSIKNTYQNSNLFPDAKSAAAPDADQNGFINRTDSNAIMDYYSAISVGQTYTGNIGKIDVYEVFDN